MDDENAAERLREVMALHSSLVPDARDDLLQELLAGYGAGGTEQMGIVLEGWLLDLAGREWLKEL